jgi:predicted Zn-dependent peptidase
LSKSILS